MSKVTRFNFDDHYQVSPDLNGKHVFLTFADYEALRERAERAERDRDFLGAEVTAWRVFDRSNIAKVPVIPGHPHYDLHRALCQRINGARKIVNESQALTRCTPASREGA